MDAGKIIWTIFLSLLAFVTIIVNAYIVYAVYKCKKLQSRCNAFLLSLAFSDFLVAIFNVPFTASCSIYPALRTTGSQLCNISGFLEMTFLIASVFSVTAMNFHRYIHIIHWQNYYEIFSIKRVSFIVIFIWSGAVILSVPPLFGLSKISYKVGKSHCFVDWKATPVYTFALMIICFLIPVSIMGYFYVRIYLHRKNSKNDLNTISKGAIDKNHTSKENKLPKGINNSSFPKKESVVKTKGNEELDVKIEEDDQDTPISDSQIHLEIGVINDCHMKDDDSSKENEIKEAKSNINRDENSARKQTRFLENVKHHDVFVIWKKFGPVGQSELEGEEIACENIQISFDRAISCSDSLSNLTDNSKDSCQVSMKHIQQSKILSKRNCLNAAKRATKEERKLTMMCIIIVAVFFVSWFPFVITMMVDKLSSDSTVPSFIDKATLLFGYMNSLSNPIIYFYFNRNFRRHFISIFRRFKT